MRKELRHWSLEASARDIEEQIKQIHEDLDPRKAGKMIIGSVRGTAPGAMLSRT
jgi:hypothetical protein